MLQLEFADPSSVQNCLHKTRKVFDDNAREITSFEFDELVWKNRWDLISCWKVTVIAFNLNIGDALDDLHDEIADHVGD